MKDRLIREFSIGQGELNETTTLLLPNKGPGDFTSQMYTNLSAEPGMPMSADTAVKALMAAVAFKPISDTTKFVRDNMLDDGIVDLRELRESLNFWQDMKKRTDMAAKQINELTILKNIGESVITAGQSLARNQHIDLSFRIEQCNEAISPAQERLDDITEEIGRLTEKKEQVEGQLEEANETLFSKRVEYQSQDVTQQIEAEKNKKQSGAISLGQLDIKVNNLSRTCLGLKPLTDDPAISQGCRDIAGKIVETIDSDAELLNNAWLDNQAPLNSHIEDALHLVEPEIQRLAARRTGLWSELGPLRSECEALQERINRLEKKESPLDKNTRDLVDLLTSERIPSIPLCDLIDITDEKWRNTIETILGKKREALVVPPDRAREAIRLYRHEGKHCRGSHVVNTTKTDQWTDMMQKGSLAELVETDHPHARAFVNLQLGNIIRVETESELQQHKRAATTDLMFTSGGTTSQKFEVDPIIGRKKRAALKATLIKRRDDKASSAEVIEDHLTKLELAVGKLSDFLQFFTDTETGYADLAERRANLSSEIERLTNKIAQLEKNDTSGLKQEIAKLNDVIASLSQSETQCNNEINEKNTAKARLEVEIETYIQQSDTLIETRTAHHEQHPGVDLADAADRMDRMRDKYAGSDSFYSEVLSVLDSEKERREDQIQKGKEKLLLGMQEYFVHHQSSTQELNEMSLHSVEDRLEFVGAELTRIEETELANHRSQAERALFEVEKLFRDSFVGRLAERLKSVRETIRGLNASLKRLPFHDEYCQFKYHPAPELKSIYDYAMSFEQGSAAETGGLFDPGNDEKSPHHETIQFIKDALEDDEVMSKTIQDYRQYYVFDVEMYNRDDERVATLSHRLVKGSGGENQSPFYVAIGSSLSTAFMIKPKGDGSVYGGFCLAPFDEAFSKLDESNTINCLEFMKQINLQVLLAAPDEKMWHIAPMIDTMIEISRDGSDIFLEEICLSDQAHDLLLSDSPFKSTGG